MEIPIIVEPHARGWRARCRHPVPAEATGATRYDAVQAIELQLASATGGPVVLLPLEVTPDKPWIASAGGVPDDALTADWLAAIEAYRRERDAEDQAALGAPSAQQVP